MPESFNADAIRNDVHPFGQGLVSKQEADNLSENNSIFQHNPLTHVPHPQQTTNAMQNIKFKARAARKNFCSRSSFVFVPTRYHPFLGFLLSRAVSPRSFQEYISRLRG